MTLWAAVFAAMFVLDFVWARYTAAITARWALCAGFHAITITAINGAATISYVANPWLLIPAIAGAFLGTVVAVKWGKP